MVFSQLISRLIRSLQILFYLDHRQFLLRTAILVANNFVLFPLLTSYTPDTNDIEISTIHLHIHVFFFLNIRLRLVRDALALLFHSKSVKRLASKEREKENRISVINRSVLSYI